MNSPSEPEIAPRSISRPSRASTLVRLHWRALERRQKAKTAIRKPYTAPPRPPEHYVAMRKLSRAVCSPLTADDILMILEYRKQGMTLKSIGALYDLGESAICRIVNGNRWADVTNPNKTP